MQSWRGGRRPLTIVERLGQAQEARERGRIDEALSVLDGICDTDPAAALIWRTRGLLEFERDRARPAEAALLRALALDSKLQDARRDLVNLYTIEARTRELRHQLQALSEAGSLSFSDLYLWCLGRRLEVGHAEIAARLERMLANDPDDRSVRLALVENLRRLGRLDEADALLTPLDTGDSRAVAARALLSLDRGDVDGAQRFLAECANDDPSLAQLRGRLALAQADPAAAARFRTALLTEPEDRDSLFGLGQALRLTGQPEAAKPYLQAAYDRDHLEWLVQNACSLDKRDDPAVLRAVGDACRSLHRLPEARAWYRLALAHNTADADLQKSLFAVDATIEREVRRGRSAEPAK
jgi:tetratricopeptide (TPR) repeat protein